MKSKTFALYTSIALSAIALVVFFIQPYRMESPVLLNLLSVFFLGLGIRDD